jgi:hypothetical protein
MGWYFLAFALMAKGKNVSEGSFNVHATTGLSLMYDLIAVFFFFFQMQKQRYNQMYW